MNEGRKQMIRIKYFHSRSVTLTMLRETTEIWLIIFYKILFLGHRTSGLSKRPVNLFRLKMPRMNQKKINNDIPCVHIIFCTCYSI